MKKNGVVFLLCVFNFLYAGFAKDTIVKTQSFSEKIQLLSSEHKIVSLDIKQHCNAVNEIVYTFTISTGSYCCIELPETIIECLKEQRFYDPSIKKWVEARTLSESSFLLNYSGESVPCIKVSRIEQERKICFYEIALNESHTYFVSSAEVLVHNPFAIPIAIGLSWVFGEGITLTGGGVGLGALGFGLWKMFGKNKGIRLSQVQKECRSLSASGSPGPDNDDEFTVEDLIRSSRPGAKTKGPSTQYEKAGDFQQAQDDFNRMKLSNVRDIPKGRIGKLPDGKIVNVRMSSSAKVPTLEVYDSVTRKSIKIRYIGS